jgi:hypothetical protein
MTYTTQIRNYLISHYTKRLAAERIKGNTLAINFLRTTLHQLKKSNNQ